MLFIILELRVLRQSNIRNMTEIERNQEEIHDVFKRKLAGLDTKFAQTVFINADEVLVVTDEVKRKAARIEASIKKEIFDFMESFNNSNKVFDKKYVALKFVTANGVTKCVRYTEFLNTIELIPNVVMNEDNVIFLDGCRIKIEFNWGEYYNDCLTQLILKVEQVNGKFSLIINASPMASV